MVRSLTSLGCCSSAPLSAAKATESVSCDIVRNRLASVMDPILGAFPLFSEMVEPKD